MNDIAPLRTYYRTLLPYYESALEERGDLRFWESMAQRWSAGRILELGCGTGRVTEVLTARAAVIAVIDLDDLKEMNDQRGHLHGDLLLRLAAQTLRRAVRPFDVVARVGGDEFAVMAVDYEGDPRVFAARLGDALEAADIHASLGVAMPMPTESLTDAYADADRAMYAQKRHRRQRTGA